MSSSTFRILFSLFLIAHGLVTIRILVPAPKPGTKQSDLLPSWRQDDVDESWPITTTAGSGASLPGFTSSIRMRRRRVPKAEPAILEETLAEARMQRVTADQVAEERHALEAQG